MRPPTAKILQHSEGLGTPTADTVRVRAHEIATINGHAEFSGEDWEQAKRELHGGHLTNSGNGDHKVCTLVSEHDMVVCHSGHHIENMEPEDAANIAEELLAEGMDEALHEQMLAARSQEPIEEDEIDEPRD